MENETYVRLYTHHGKCGEYENWTLVPFGYIQNANAILEESATLIDDSRVGIREYNLDGDVVETQFAAFPNSNLGWSLRLSPKYEDGLEELTQKLGLPIEIEV